MSETAAAPAKSKKLILIGAIVLLLVVVAAAAAWVVLGKRNALEDDEAGAGRASPSAAAKAPPTFMPLENMVVNLADPGGDRFAQIGITLELADSKAAEQVKLYMPSIRSGVLLLVSQRTSDELLSREGKDKLAQDVRREVSRPLGYAAPKPRKRQASPEADDEDDEQERPQRPRDTNPVRQVLFSSFIIQ